jgi:hypothetical protein
VKVMTAETVGLEQQWDTYQKGCATVTRICLSLLKKTESNPVNQAVRATSWPVHFSEELITIGFSSFTKPA